jgi:hypothetical protein
MNRKNLKTPTKKRNNPQFFLGHCTKINGTFIHIPSLTGRLIVAGDILFYQHSVPDGTGNAATLPQINYKLRITN